MEIVKKIVLGLAGFFVVTAIVGFLLPREVNVERSITIDASQEEVFAFLDNYSRFNEWSPWAEHDPETQYTFTGPERGVGAGMAWRSDHENVGSGSQTIIEAIPHSFIRTRLDFGPHGIALASYRLDPVANMGQTTVTWAFETDLGFNPYTRYLRFMMDGLIGPDYEKGLSKLKSVVEGDPI